MHHYGEGVEKDYKEAMKWYLLSANQGDLYAQKRLGYLYKTEYEDVEKSLYWFLKCFDKLYGDNILKRKINKMMSIQKSRLCILYEN